MRKLTFLMAVFVIAAGVFLFHPKPANAQLTITTIKDLDFGRFVLTSPTTNVGRVRISPNGVTSTNAFAITIDPGDNAEFQVTGGPANTAYTVTIDSITVPGLGGAGGSPDFRLDQFRVRPTTLQTNGAGEDTFRVGARLRTNTTTFYNNGTYSGSYDFTVQF